jgi:hypothetical protein
MNARPTIARGLLLLPLLAAVATAGVWVSTASAQEEDEDDDASSEPEASPDDEEASDDASGEEKDVGDESASMLDAPPDSTPEKLLPGHRESTYYLGLRYRGIVIPKFVIGLFVDGGTDVYVHGFGPELAIVQDDIEYNLSAWASLYDMSPVAIKGASNEEEAWEIVESDITAIYLSGDVLWRTELSSGVALAYGGSGGLGFLFGDLYRTQAFLRNGGTEGNADDYQPCVRLDEPSLRYCDDANTHYAGYGEPGWLNGGAKPFVFPWISGQIGLRYQPHEKLITRLDVGLGTSGFFFGVGADYGL